MEPATSPHSRYHYSNSLEEEKSNHGNQASQETIVKQEKPTKDTFANEISKKESK